MPGGYPGVLPDPPDAAKYLRRYGPGKPLRKRIIVCCDGTWQSSDSAESTVPSNVARLCYNLADTGIDTNGETWAQVKFYDSGVGTGDLLFIDKALQGSTGFGLEAKVLEAYNFVAMNYAPGDEVYCFGFSRGAYTARAVAGLITDVGICSPDQLTSLPELYTLYKQHTDDTPFLESKAYFHFLFGEPDLDRTARHLKLKYGTIDWSKATFDDWQLKLRPNAPFDNKVDELGKLSNSRQVKVVGVWDTVGALGVPNIHGIDLQWLGGHPRFHNVRISPRIENAFHAIALDEHRSAFSPTLWYIRKDDPLLSRKDTFFQPPDPEAIARCAAEHESCCRGYNKDTMPIIDSYPRDANGNVVQTNLEQCWFPGMHINVGGGNTEGYDDRTGDFEELSNITFFWMLEKVSPFLAFDKGRLDSEFRRNNYNRVLLAKVSLPLTILEKGEVAIGTVPAERFPVIPSLGWGTGSVVDSCSGATALAGSTVRRPGQETTTDIDGKVKPLTELGMTNESIHPVVAWRMQKLGPKHYQPQGLKGWVRQKRTDGKAFEYVQKDKNDKVTLTLPEFVISDQYVRDASWERKIIPRPSDAVSWLDSVDQVTGQTRFFGKILDLDNPYAYPFTP